MDQRLGFCSQCGGSLNSRGDVIACGRCGMPVFNHPAAVNPQSKKVPPIPAEVLAEGFGPFPSASPVAVEAPMTPPGEMRPRRGR